MIITDEEVKRIINDSYDYYYLYQKPIVETENYIVKNDEKYYYVELENINSKDNINSLLERLYDKLMVDIKKDELYSSRSFEENDGKLYFRNIGDSECEVNYDLKEKNYSFFKVDNDVNVRIGDDRYHEFTFYKTENGYRVKNSLYDCIFNFKSLKNSAN